MKSFVFVVTRFKTNSTLIEPITTESQPSGLLKHKHLVIIIIIYLYFKTNSLIYLDFGVAIHNVRDLTDDPALARKGYANAVYHLQRTKVRQKKNNQSRNRLPFSDESCAHRKHFVKLVQRMLNRCVQSCVNFASVIDFCFCFVFLFSAS